MRISYDREEDVLYIKFADCKEECEYVEHTPGVVLRVNPRSKEIVGCTILWFSRQLREQGRINVPEIRGLPISPELERLVGL